MAIPKAKQLYRSWVTAAGGAGAATAGPQQNVSDANTMPENVSDHSMSRESVREREGDG